MLFNKIYHVYNHANANDLLFESNYCYDIFLEKLTNYITPYADIYAFCLMPNHFHMVLKIHSEEEVVRAIQLIHNPFNRPAGRRAVAIRLNQLQNPDKFFSKRFADCFNSFAKHTNLVRHRRGSLFMKSFKNIVVDTEHYMSYLIYYVHINPVKHEFRKTVQQWQWSSYRAYIKDEFDFVKKDFVLNHFGGIEAFIDYHKRPYRRSKKDVPEEERVAAFLAKFKYL